MSDQPRIRPTRHRIERKAPDRNTVRIFSDRDVFYQDLPAHFAREIIYAWDNSGALDVRGWVAYDHNGVEVKLRDISRRYEAAH